MSDVDQGPSDDELFNEAISDETTDAPVVSEVEQPVQDEAGRFAKKEEPEASCCGGAGRKACRRRQRLSGAVLARSGDQ
jgi:hypothetical protein